MASQITGGEVGFGRTVKTGDFENKRVDVKLSFTVGDGEDYSTILALAAQQAHAKCHEMLGLREKPLPAPANQPAPGANGKVAPTTTGPIVETAGPAEAANKARAKRPPKIEQPDPAAVDVAAEQPPAKTPEPPKAAEPDPAAVVEEEWAGAASEITDADLMGAITKKNGEIKNPVLIRNLIGKYVPAPKPAREIPQDKRQAFLNELTALKPAQAA